MTASCCDSGTRSVRPSGRKISSARSSWASSTPAPGDSTDMAAPTWAGVLVMTRTTGVPAGSRCAKKLVGTPAHSDTTSWPDTAEPISFSTAPASLGFTAISSTSASPTASRLDTVRTPYRSCSSAARSARRAVASSCDAGLPDRSSPDRTSSPSFPAPITATVLIATPPEKPEGGRSAALRFSKI